MTLPSPLTPLVSQFASRPDVGSRRRMREPYSWRLSWKQMLCQTVDLEPEIVARFWSDPDLLVDQGEPLKRGNRCTVSRLDFERRSLVIKRYNLRSRWHTGLHACLRSRGRHTFQAGHRLAAAGVVTPRPLAFLERRWGPFCGRSYLLTEWLEGPLLATAVRDQVDNPAAVEPLVAEMGRLWQQLGSLRTSHGDMKTTNFIVHQGRIAVIDLDAVRVHRHGLTLQGGRARDRRRFLRDWQSQPQVARQFAAVMT